MLIRLEIPEFSTTEAAVADPRIDLRLAPGDASTLRKGTAGLLGHRVGRPGRPRGSVRLQACVWVCIHEGVVSGGPSGGAG